MEHLKESRKIEAANVHIALFLCKNYGFKRIRGRCDELDFDKHTHVLRIGEIHYMYYSMLYNKFSIGVRHGNPKTEPGRHGKLIDRTVIMIPKIINNIDDAKAAVEGVCNVKNLKLFPI